jgi:3-isopropylmalate dehydrogenase
MGTEPFTVIVLPGDGIGPEVTGEGVRVLAAAAGICGLDIAFRQFEVGERLFEATGVYMEQDAVDACDRGQAEGNAAILFGAVPFEPIGMLRERYDLFANLRPVRSYPSLSSVSPLKPEVIDGVDLLIVRELTSDVYYGTSRRGDGGPGVGAWASQEMYYNEHQVARVAKVAFEQARGRGRRLTFAHKANAICEVFDVWWNVLNPMRAEYPDVEFDDLYVDNMAAQLCMRPADFDVILAPNLFGDILSDMAGGLLGSLGLLPSASLNASGFGLYEPVSGTAPTIAGMGIANPIGSILSAAMLCEHALGRKDARDLIEDAVRAAVPIYRTKDITSSEPFSASTSELGTAVTERMHEMAAKGAYSPAADAQ